MDVTQLNKRWLIVLSSVLFPFILLAQDTDLDQLEEALASEDSPENVVSSKTNLKNAARSINLREILEEGLRKNVDEKIRKHQRVKFDLAFQDDLETFWYPDLNLVAQSGPQSVRRLYEDTDDGEGLTNHPNGYFGLSVGDYTVFNWGKDYLNYLNSKNSYQRNKQVLIEQRRALRFKLIAQYFNLVRAKKILRLRKEQQRHTSFIHRLAREKLSLKKIKPQEFFQTKAEFLLAQTKYQEANFQAALHDELLANLLGDDIQTTYKPQEILKFKMLGTNQSESLKLAGTKSPVFRTAKTELENANRSYERTLKENLPLPKFSIDFGAYNYNFDQSSGAYNSFATDDSNRNIELVATLNMKWSIFGDGGLLNSRKNKQAYLDKRIAEIKYSNTRRAADLKVRTLYRTIRHLEKKVEFSELQYKNGQVTFDSTLDNYMSGKTSFPDVKHALDNLINSNLEYENSKYSHLVKKFELSDIMGLEDFPGENFETLATK